MPGVHKHIHSDTEKRRSFLAMLFAAGDVKRYMIMEIHWRTSLKRKIFSLIALLFFLTIFTGCSSENTYQHATVVSRSYGTYSRVGKQKFHATITKDDFKEYPAWVVGHKLPLSIPEASEIALVEVQNYSSDKQRWFISGIELERFGDGDNWFYVIEFFRKSKEDNEMTNDDYLKIPVLFDGTPIKGIKE